jgi:hypothetical protein
MQDLTLNSDARSSERGILGRSRKAAFWKALWVVPSHESGRHRSRVIDIDIV